MSEGTSQPADQPSRTRAAQGTRRIRAERIITHRFGLNDAPQALQVVAHPGEALKVVLLAEGSTANAADSFRD